MKQPLVSPMKLPVDDGLVLYLPCQEGTGRITADLSGRDNHGTLSNVGWRSGLNGHACDFVIANQSIINVPADKSLDLSKVSVVVVAKSDILGSAYTNTPFLVSKKNTTQGTYGIGVAASSNKIFFRVLLDGSEGTPRDIFADAELDTGRHIYIGTYDGSDSLLEIDGVQQADTLSVAGSIDTDNSDILAIGRNPDVAANVWDGLIETVMVFNRALSKNKKRRIYEALL